MPTDEELALLMVEERLARQSERVALLLERIKALTARAEHGLRAVGERVS
jgi:hypothetical protein